MQEALGECTQLDMRCAMLSDVFQLSHVRKLGISHFACSLPPLTYTSYFGNYHHHHTMAEIFAAVASGAGLLSLAIQLLESSRKLKDFYNASKDVPQTVADLSFELETMSLSLRQLETHRRADILDDQLLGRCVITCTRMTVKVEAAVAKMDHLLKRFRGVGMVYTAFKEPEMRKLLEELEYAKSSMLFAYMSYCQ
jgi:hypothetical protein